MSGSAGGKFVSSNHSSSKLISAGSPIMASLHHPEAFMIQEQKVNFSSGIPNEPDKEADGTLALLKPLGLDQGSRDSLDILPATHSTEGDRVDMMHTHYENSLFSSSLSDLCSQKSEPSFPFPYIYDK